MSDITLITPPDHIYNESFSWLLIYPSAKIKDDFNEILANDNKVCNVYLYEEQKDFDFKWLLTSAKIADCIILDIDNCPPELQTMIGYFLANPRTYWLTNGENIMYNTVSNKRIYNLDFINGGTIEKKQ